MILQGRVSINGKIVRELGTKVDPSKATVAVDGQRISNERPVYFAVYKPKGYVSTNNDPAGRPRVLDILPEIPQRVYTVGRLDESSTGLMILTNDGELANKLAHPKFGVEKIYRVVVAGTPTKEVLDQLTAGIWLAEGKVRAKRVRIVGKRGDATILEMVLAEGKNREVRRMLAKLGNKVMTLTRIAVGPISIKGLSSGEFRSLTGREVDLLRRAADGEFISRPTAQKRDDRTERPATPRPSAGPRPQSGPPPRRYEVGPSGARSGGGPPRRYESGAAGPRPGGGPPPRRSETGGPGPRPQGGPPRRYETDGPRPGGPPPRRYETEGPRPGGPPPRRFEGAGPGPRPGGGPPPRRYEAGASGPRAGGGPPPPPSGPRRPDPRAEGGPGSSGGPRRPTGGARPPMQGQGPGGPPNRAAGRPPAPDRPRIQRPEQDVIVPASGDGPGLKTPRRVIGLDLPTPPEAASSAASQSRRPATGPGSRPKPPRRLVGGPPGARKGKPPKPETAGE